MQQSLKNLSKNNEFLQSSEWRKFQEAVGRKTFSITEGDFSASIIEHQLPIVGKYFYIPRGPVIPAQAGIQFPESDSGSEAGMTQLLNLAKENNVGWIRLDPATEEMLSAIKNSTKHKIVKSPHNMQPKEIFVVDIMKPEEEILTAMKSKTRYNIKLSQKHKVFVKAILTFKSQISNQAQNPNDKKFKFYIDEFLRLTKIMAKRQGIVSHPDKYYRKMFETIPGENLKLYVAEYDNKVIAANIVVFYGKTATYLHGASDDEFRNVMAPYLLQWQAIKDAKAAGCANYDFGGIKTRSKNNEERSNQNSWEGTTRFKLGFSPETKPLEFPGSYDIVINPIRYKLYRVIQKAKTLVK